MAEKFKKINKEYLLTDSSVNSYGFRLLTAGYQIDEYKKNPIGYNMHLRDGGVLVKWEDLKIKGDAVFGKPVINLSNARGQQTVDEIENDFLNAASMGHFVVLEMSDDADLKLPGQTGPTVTKWYNRECSLVDIPGNYNSLKLFDKDDNEINLADFSKHSNFNMKKIILTAAQLTQLNLKADADDAAIETAFDALVAKAAQVDGLQTQLNAANTAKGLAETALADLKKANIKNEVEQIIATGLADKKLTVEIGNKLKADYAENPTGLKALVDAMPAYNGIVKTIEGGKTVSKSLADKSYEELDTEGKLEELKASDPDLFKAKYKEEYGVDYKD